MTKNAENPKTTNQAGLSNEPTLELRRVPISATRVVTDTAEPATIISGFTLLSPIAYGARMRKATRNFLIFFGLSLIGLLIPPFHLIQFSVLAFLSIFMAINAYVDDVEITGLFLTCRCGQQVKLAAEKKSDTYPFWVKCSSCQSEYKIEKTK